MVVIKNATQIYTTVDEDKTINECFEIINGIMAQMCSCDCDEMQSLATGEVITVDDLRRVLGVLDGLPHMGVMYKAR